MTAALYSSFPGINANGGSLIPASQASVLLSSYSKSAGAERCPAPYNDAGRRPIAPQEASRHLRLANCCGDWLQRTLAYWHPGFLAVALCGGNHVIYRADNLSSRQGCGAHKFREAD